MLSGSRRKGLPVRPDEVGKAREGSRGPDREEPAVLLGRQTNQSDCSKTEKIWIE